MQQRGESNKGYHRGKGHRGRGGYRGDQNRGRGGFRGRSSGNRGRNGVEPNRELERETLKKVQISSVDASTLQKPISIEKSGLSMKNNDFDKIV